MTSIKTNWQSTFLAKWDSWNYGDRTIEEDSLKDFIDQATEITSFNLSFCKKITVDGFDYLINSNKVQNLKRLNLKGCEIINVSITKIVRLTNLIMLDLTDCRVTNAGLKIIATQLTKLETLNLENCIEIDDEGIKALTQLSTLRRLNLTNCKITYTGFKAIAIHLKNLTELSVGKCYKITDVVLKHFATLPNLETLDLESCHLIEDEGLKHLVTLQKMKTLNLGRCKKITDEGLEYLGELGNLESLNLMQCLIRGPGLRHLAQLTHLVSLNLLSCSEIWHGNFKLYLTDARGTPHFMKMQEVFNEYSLLVPDLYRFIRDYLVMPPIRVVEPDSTLGKDHYVLY